MLAEKITALILDQIEFEDAELETLAEQAFANIAGLTRATLEFEAAAGLEPDSTAGLEIGSNLVDLAGEFGKAFPSLSPDQKARIKALFAGVFENVNEALETAGENLFNWTLDTITSTQALTAYVNKPAPQPE